MPSGSPVFTPSLEKLSDQDGSQVTGKALFGLEEHPIDDVLSLKVGLSPFN